MIRPELQRRVPAVGAQPGSPAGATDQSQDLFSLPFLFLHHLMAQLLAAWGPSGLGNGCPGAGSSWVVLSEGGLASAVLSWTPRDCCAHVARSPLSPSYLTPHAPGGWKFLILGQESPGS